MSGVTIMVRLLLAEPAVTALVATDNIIGDVVPLNTALPAIGVLSLSARPFRALTKGEKQHWSERVSVTILAARSPDLRPLLLAVAKCDRKAPVVDGITDISVVMLDADGEFAVEDAAMRGQNIEFMVSYNALT